MEKEVQGVIVSVAKQWWLKINTKPIRTHALDGAVFPHIIKVRYTVSGTDFFCRKWIPARQTPPSAGSCVKVFYREDKPSKARVEL